MNQKEIDKIINTLREINFDEFVPKLTIENNIENLYKELELLKSKSTEERNLRNAIVEHLHNNMADNLYKKFPVDEFKYDFQILGESINAYIDELEINTINKENFNLILKTLPEQIFVFDFNNNIYYSNSEGEKFLNDKIVKKYFLIDEYIPKRLGNRIEFFKQTQKQQEVFFLSLKNKDLTTDYFEINLINIEFEQKDQILLICKDITQQKNAELNTLKGIIQGQDQERKRLASDLHDTLGQELGAIKFYLGSLSLMEKNTVEFKECLQEIDKMMNDTISSVRAISFDLMPFILENNTLDIAIDQLCKQSNSVYTAIISFNSSVSNLTRKDKKEESIIYRIVQEFITNSVKHSQAKHLDINISKKKSQIIFNLKDDGIGFDLDTVQKNNGLRNINHRLDILEAEYEWLSNKNHGTCLIFTLYENN
jgi:signal transduction histidine kinase